MSDIVEKVREVGFVRLPCARARCFADFRDASARVDHSRLSFAGAGRPSELKSPAITKRSDTLCIAHATAAAAWAVEHTCPRLAQGCKQNTWVSSLNGYNTCPHIVVQIVVRVAL